jgi:hypothetical protein
VLERQGSEINNLMLVLLFDDDGIEFDGMKACRVCRGDSVENQIETPASRYRSKFLRIERVDADIDPIEARAAEVIRNPGEQEPVGGHRDFVDTRESLHLADKFRDMRPDGRLASRQPQFAKTEPGAKVDDSQEFFIGEDFVARLELHPDRRHAIDTAEITAIGKRDTKIGHHPPIGVLGSLAGEFRVRLLDNWLDERLDHGWETRFTFCERLNIQSLTIDDTIAFSGIQDKPNRPMLGQMEGNDGERDV